MKTILVILGLLLIVLIVIEVNKWAICSTYMVDHLSGLKGR